MLSEAQFQRQVIELATLCGYHCYHTFNSRRCAAGFPDLVLARGGAVLFVELKTERGRVSNAQRDWIAATGAEVWRPKDWPHIEATLSG